MMVAHVDKRSEMKQLAQLLMKCDEASKSLPADVIKILNHEARRTRKWLNDETGRFLHRLRDHHDRDKVETAIDMFPLSLSWKDEKGRLPVQSAVYNHKSSDRFIPLLAEKGSTLGIGGAGMRGGLLCEVPGELLKKNLIQCIASLMPGDLNDEAAIMRNEMRRLRILRSLRAKKLLVKEDVSQMQLLENHAIFRTSQRRFMFFADLDRTGLKTIRVEGQPLIHFVINNKNFNIETFETVLRTSFKHFPNSMGFLFRKHDWETACEAAIRKYGIDEAITCIKKCIPPGMGHPILHSVVKHVPQLENLFVAHYFDEVDIKDRTGRSLSHVKIARGCKNDFTLDALFFKRGITDKELMDRDPVTSLYMFMLAAADNNCDLTGVYALIRRHLKIVSRQDLDSGGSNCRGGSGIRGNKNRKRKWRSFGGLL